MNLMSMDMGHFAEHETPQPRGCTYWLAILEFKNIETENTKLERFYVFVGKSWKQQQRRGKYAQLKAMER